MIPLKRYGATGSIAFLRFRTKSCGSLVLMGTKPEYATDCYGDSVSNRFSGGEIAFGVSSSRRQVCPERGRDLRALEI
jgi:hypothetical protein